MTDNFMFDDNNNNGSELRFDDSNISNEFRFDAIVIGAGHAGIEAGLALSRKGKKTLVLAISLESVGFMACNPSIGGTAKGHLVREIDALGGEMGIAADKALLQLRMLNDSKGFAVQSLRGQVDKYKYHRCMKSVLENTPNLHLREGEAISIIPASCGIKGCDVFGSNKNDASNNNANNSANFGNTNSAANINISMSSYENISTYSAENCGDKPDEFLNLSNLSYVPTNSPDDNFASVDQGANNKGFVVRTRHLVYYAKTVVVCCGVYLKSKILIGSSVEEKGPSGFMRAAYLSDSLTKMGIKLRRFKTGTPARIKRDSVQLHKLEVQEGGVQPYSFSQLSKKINASKTVCFLGYTNLETHQIIEENLSKTPRKLGNTEGIGARYCPSIEDKIERFDRTRHQFFLEPEGEHTQEMYIQGMSTSLPADVQLKMYRSIEGFKNAEVMRDAYAIEYDCIDATGLLPTLMHKKQSGLFFAGQINGTSGYEEAAAQGLVAGINAALFLEGKPPMIMRRDTSYIGVMIDDLVTKGTDEPYRIMTSRAEYRLHLRQDNADLRLTPVGREVGLVNGSRLRKFHKKKLGIEQINRLLTTRLMPAHDMPKSNFDEILSSTSDDMPCSFSGSKNISSPASGNDTAGDNISGQISSCGSGGKTVGNIFTQQSGEALPERLCGLTLEAYIKRHDVSFEDVMNLNLLRGIGEDAVRDVFIRLRYGGYIEREERTRREQGRLESMLLPLDVDYKKVAGLRTEAAEKLNKIKPHSIGQAARIPGVNPADINVLIVKLSPHQRRCPN